MEGVYPSICTGLVYQVKKISDGFNSPSDILMQNFSQLNIRIYLADVGLAFLT